MPEPRPRVLIVDDDASFGGFVAEALEDKGYETVRCTDPREAIERAGDGSFAAAVLDLVMPQMGGLELAQRIRSASPDTQVVILTGQADMDSAIEGIHHGVVDYLHKGTIQIPKLERSVRAAVDKSRLTRENRELLDRLRESNRLLKALQEVSTELAGELHLDRLLSRLVAAAKELCRAAAGRALLLERTPSEELVIEGGVGEGAESILGARLHPDEGIAILALERDEVVLVAEPKQHPRYSHRCDEMATDLPGLLCAPLRHGMVQGVLMLAGSRNGGFSTELMDALAGLARQAAVAIENALQRERWVNFFTHVSEILVSALESVDIHYQGHSRRVAALSDMLTRRLGLGDTDRRNVHFAALLHDIGKIRLDPAILRAPGYATEDGRRQIQEHPALGLDMLRPITVWEEILPIIHAHHERWDGKGYPRGLAGEGIPLGARVVSVADAFDAMTRDTPHGPKRSPAEALAELEAFAGTQFDPRIVRLFAAEYRQHGEQFPG